MKITPLHVLGAGTGALLLYSAIKDRNPLDTVKAVLTGQSVPEAGSWAPEGYGLTFAGSDTGAGVGLGGSAIGSVGGSSWPTTSHSLGPGFGEKGPHWATTHDGQDIDGACGDPIFAPTAGVIKSAGYAGAYGNRIVLKSFSVKDTEYWLCHLSSMSVRPGSTVSAGQKVGSMGQTGNAFGCHLHVTVVHNGQKVDPLPYLKG